MAQKGFLAAHQNLFAPSVFWEHNSSMLPDHLAVRYRLAGRRLLPRNMSRSDVHSSPSCAPPCAISLPPPGWTGQPWEPGLKMKELVVPCVVNQELRSTMWTATWKRNMFIRSLIFRSAMSSNHSDTYSGILASCILPGIYSSNAPPSGQLHLPSADKWVSAGSVEYIFVDWLRRSHEEYCLAKLGGNNNNKMPSQN